MNIYDRFMSLGDVRLEHVVTIQVEMAKFEVLAGEKASNMLVLIIDN